MESIHETKAHRALDRDTARRDQLEHVQIAARDQLAAVLLDSERSASAIMHDLLGEEGTAELALDLLIIKMGLSKDREATLESLADGALENLLEHGENELIAGYED